MNVRIRPDLAEEPAAGQDEPDPLVEQIVADSEPMMARLRRVMSAIWQDRSVSKLNLLLLMQLDCNGPLPMGRLAELANVSLPNLTGIVSRMEELGHVERIRDDHDRRVVLVRPTPLGLAAVEEIQSIRRQHLRRMLEELEPRELLACRDAFRALSRAAERLDAAEGPRIASRPATQEPHRTASQPATQEPHSPAT